MPTLGHSIRLARLQAELTLNDLAACLDVPAGTLASWERDLESPRHENLVRLTLQFPELVRIVDPVDNG